LKSQRRNEKLTMIQPHLLTHLIQKFEDKIKGKRKFLNPCTPRFKFQKSSINMDVLDTHYQRRYRSGDEMLLYLTKYSCLDICYIVQELSKYMGFEIWGTYSELFRVIKFVIDTKTLL
jgi:hypothetical protein